MSSRFVTTEDGERLSYDVRGTGPPAVLIHGGLWDRRMWDPQDARHRRPADLGDPGGRKVVMAAADHLPNVRRPDEFNRLVIDFLEEPG